MRHDEFYWFQDSEYAVDERQYVISAHDMRTEPITIWAYNSIRRILSESKIPELTPRPATLLSKERFYVEADRALSAYLDPAQLATNPLGNSAMARRYPATGENHVLVGLLDKALNTLPKAERDLLRESLLKPDAPKQIAQAHDLNVSERTLRRKRAQAKNHLIDALWRLETQP